MGLIEKRLVKAGQEEWIPEAQAELRGLTTGNQVIEVDWASFTEAAALNNVQYQALRRINSAFRLICEDDLGKEAANESVAKVVVHNVGKASEKSIILKDGILTVSGAFASSDGYFQDIELKNTIEKLL